MFRIKVQIDPTLLIRYMERVKVGVPGEAFVQLGPNAAWPDRLAVKLPSDGAQ